MFSDYINFLKLVHQCDYFKINGILVNHRIYALESFPVMLYASLIYSDNALLWVWGAEETPYNGYVALFW